MLEARDIGAAVSELRGEKSQVLLAEEAEIDPADLSRLEEGSCLPSDEILLRLIESLGISEPEFDLRVIDHWRRRIGEALPHSLEGKRLELFEHLKVIGLRLRMMVRTLDDMTVLSVRRNND